MTRAPASTVDYGSQPPPAPKPRRSDSAWETVTGYYLVALVAIAVVLGLAVPITYYVATVVPVQHQQTFDLRTECLAHHTVKACMQLTDGVVEP